MKPPSPVAMAIAHRKAQAALAKLNGLHGTARKTAHYAINAHMEVAGCNRQEGWAMYQRYQAGEQLQPQQLAAAYTYARGLAGAWLAVHLRHLA